MREHPFQDLVLVLLNNSITSTVDSGFALVSAAPAPRLLIKYFGLHFTKKDCFKTKQNKKACTGDTSRQGFFIPLLDSTTFLLPLVVLTPKILVSLVFQCSALTL